MNKKKIKFTWGVFSTKKKIVTVLPMLNSGSFSKIKSTIAQNVLRRSKKQKSEQAERMSLKHQLSSREIFISKISTLKLLT